MRKIIQFAIALFLLLPICGTAWAGDHLEIIDTAGRKVKVPTNPERIVCLGPGCLRLIVYLQALDKVVGVEKMERRMGGRPYYLAHRKAIDSLPAISPGGPGAINKKPDLEAILKVKPQVVFITYMKAALADQVQALLGTPVVVLTYGRLASFDEVIYASLRIAGRVLNRSKRADEVIGFIESGRTDLKKRTGDLDQAEQPGVYVGGLGFRGSHGLGSTDSLYIPFNWLGARNVVAGASESGHFFLDKEKLLTIQPEMIFIDGGGLELVRTDYGKKKTFYQALKAFQKGRVHILFPYNWYTTNIGTTMADAYAIGRFISPDRFRDIDLIDKTNTIYNKLVNRPVYEDMARIYGPLGDRPSFME